MYIFVHKYALDMGIICRKRPFQIILNINMKMIYFTSICWLC